MNKFCREDYEKIGQMMACRNEHSESLIENIIDLFSPLLNKYCYINGKKDEDLYIELTIALIKCIKNFKIDNCKYAEIYQKHYNLYCKEIHENTEITDIRE